MSNATSSKPHLVRAIQDFVATFTKVNGFKPSYLYLGTNEWRELYRLAEAFGTVSMDTWTPGCAEYNGMVVYDVGDWNHLRVA